MTRQFRSKCFLERYEGIGDVDAGRFYVGPPPSQGVHVDVPFHAIVTSRPALRGLSNYGVTWLELFEGPLKPLGQPRVIDAHNVLRRGQERQTPKLGV